jgi:hypothetical protein
MADFNKAVAGNNYREGSAVTFRPVCSNAATVDKSIDRGNTNKNWDDLAATLSDRFTHFLYYEESEAP